MENIPTRNNNPGDLKNPSTGGFQDFSTPQEGYGALLNNIQSKITKNPQDTLGDFANIWAPPSDNNDTAQYTANLANKLGVSPDTKISSLEPQIGKFADAIASNEGFNGTSSIENQSVSKEPSIWDNIMTGINSMLSVPATVYGFAKSNPQITAGAGITAAGLLSGNPLAAAGGVADLMSSSQGKTTQTPTSQTIQTDTGTLNSLLANNMTEANQNSKQVQQAQLQALSATPIGSKLAQNYNYQNGALTNGMFGLTGKTLSDGRTSTTEDQQKTDSLLNELNEHIQEIENNSGANGSYKEMEKEAIAAVRADPSIPETEWKNADREISNAVQTYRKNSGGSDFAPTGRFHRIKIETGYGKKWGLMDTTTKKQTYKHLSRAARKQVEKHSKNKELYNATLKMEQNLINGKEILKRIDGKRMPKNQSLKKEILKTGGNVAAAYLGNKIGGPIGALISYMVEKHVANAVDKKYGHTIFETPAMKKSIAKLKNTQPDAYKILQMQFKKHGVKVEENEKKGKAEEKMIKGLIKPADKEHILGMMKEVNSKSTTTISQNKSYNNNKNSDRNKNRKKKTQKGIYTNNNPRK